MAKKLYYKIGEACKLLDIQPYVLRYWETEFGSLNPTKSKSGQRVYGERDLAVIRRIKELLYDEGYTIAGAKKKLAGEDLSDLPPAAKEEGKAGTGEAKAKKPTAKAKAEKPKAAASPKKAAETAKKTGPAPSKREARLEDALRKAIGELKEIQSLLDRSA